jgi:predicted dehydrogenase
MTATGSRTLGVAVIGMGVGEQHAQAFHRDQNCTIRYLCDLDARHAQEVAGRLGLDKQAVSLRFGEILEDPSVDVVSIASYDDAHYGQVIAALQAGKHVFVEKPLCRSAAELRHIEQVWQDAGKPHLAVNLVLRAAPIYRWLKTAIHEKRLGEIYAIDGDYLYGRIHKITEGWRKDVEDYSVMQGGGVHLIDLMLWLTEQQPQAATSLGSRICTRGTAFRYHDYQSATFEFSSGLIGRITANFGCVHRHQHVLRVFGTRATFIYDDQGPRLHTSRDPGHRPDFIPENTLPEHKGVLIPEFIRSILAGTPSEPTAEQEFRLMRTCFAADDAHRRGTRSLVGGT